MEEEAVKKDLERIFNSGIHPILEGKSPNVNKTRMANTYWINLIKSGETVFNLIIRLNYTNRICYLKTLWIDHEKREKGLGSKLLEHLVVYLSEYNYSGIEVKPSTNKLNDYYLKKGFKQCNGFLYLPVEPSGKNKKY